MTAGKSAKLKTIQPCYCHSNQTLCLWLQIKVCH